MAVEIRQFMKIGLKYFLEFNNYIELVIIAFSWAAFSMYIYRLYASYEVYDVLSQTGSLSTKFINLQYISTSDQLLNYFLGICTAFGSLRFLKLLRFNKRIIVFIYAFKISLKELSSFSVVFFCVWFAFVQLFYLLYNALKYNFSSLTITMNTCFQMIMGHGSGIFLNTYGNYDIMGICLFFFFVIFIVFVLMNIFLTIVYDSYMEACNELILNEEDPELFAYLKSLFLSVFFCFKTETDESKSVYFDFSEGLPSRFDEIMKKWEKVVGHKHSNFYKLYCINFCF